MAHGVLDSEILGLQTLEHLMRVSRTWDSIISLIPKGGETIWGDSDWSPEEGFKCGLEKSRPSLIKASTNNSDGKRGLSLKEHPKYGRIIAFGKAASYLPSSKLPALSVKESLQRETAINNSMCPEVWTEYDELSRENIRSLADNRAYTSETVLDLLRILAPKMMQRGEAHFSHGIADNLDDPKYNHYKYWSNPLEMKLPNAPEMEIYSLYGVGLPTERAYIYKMSPSDRCRSIPFRIDSSAEGGEEDRCLRGGVHFVDGDDTIPLISAGFMCAKGWKGKTRYNPSGMATYIREYMHKRPASLLEGRGVGSGSHVDILGNVALIEDVLRVAAGATGQEIGGDMIYSDVVRISERIGIRL